MSHKYFSKTFGPITVEWLMQSDRCAFEVKVSSIALGKLYSGLVNGRNSPVPFSFGKTQGADDILKGKLKFRTDASGQPILIIDIIICHPYNIKEIDCILSPSDAKTGVDIAKKSKLIQPIDSVERDEKIELQNPSIAIDEIENCEPRPPNSCIEIIQKSSAVAPICDPISEIAITDTEEHQELFPFVSLRTWPEISPAARKLHFIEYDTAQIPPTIQHGSFYSNLVEIKKAPKVDEADKSDAQKEIKNEAQHFIKGEEPTRITGKSYAGQFIQSIAELKGKIKSFALLDTWVRQQKQINLPTLKYGIESVLCLNWTQVKEYVKGPTRRLPEMIGKTVTEDTKGAVTGYMKEKDRVWQNFFALTIIPEYRPHLLESLTKTLVMCSLIEKITEDDDEESDGKSESGAEDLDIDTRQEILAAAKATIVLPKEIFSTLDSQTATSVAPCAIGDLQLVRQRLLRYELGEVARIENVLKGERKETTQRKLNRINESVTDNSADFNETATDIQGSRTDLLNETLKMLAKDTTTTTFDKFTTNYGPPTTVTYSGSYSVGNDSETNKPYIEDVANFAKNITAKTANRIARYVNQVRTLSTLNESEETVIHTFDNTASPNNVTGIYRWVNKIYAAHVVNCGYRLMVEFVLPNPAETYIKSLFHLQGVSLEEPTAPDQLKELHLQINSYQDITRKNYAQLATIYDIQAPPVKFKIITVTFQGGEPLNTKEIVVPEGYKADRAWVTGALSSLTQKVTVLVGKNQFDFPATTNNSASPIPPNPDGSTMNEENLTVPICVMSNAEEAFLPLPISATPHTSSPLPNTYFVTVEIRCKLADEKWQEWQITTYNAIIEAYRKQKAEYYDRAGVVPTEIASRNPLENRKIEKIELKEGCTNQLLEQHFELAGNSDGAAINHAASQWAVNQPRYIQFFEQAFEWDEMTYHFYSPLGKPENPEKLSVRDFARCSKLDSLFTSFLQAGSARVLLPVRPDFAAIVLYYLSSGTIWPGANTLAPTYEKYVSLVSELKTVAEVKHDSKYISKPWKITIPTSMSVLQESSKLPQF